MPSALVVMHERHEGLAGFGPSLAARGYAIDNLHVEDPRFLSVDFLAPDLVVIMGGAMGVYEQDRHPWMGHEIVRICERIAADRPTLGICLGSQIMAAAMGARVWKGPVVEVGYGPVTLTPEGQHSALAALGDAPLLHWHGDTFDLPERASLLASTPHYPNQAFRRGDNILALQFHPEMGEDPGIAEWCAHGQDFIATGGTTAEAILADDTRFGAAAAAAGRLMLEHWLAGLDD